MARIRGYSNSCTGTKDYDWNQEAEVRAKGKLINFFKHKRIVKSITRYLDLKHISNNKRSSSNRGNTKCPRDIEVHLQ